MSLLQKDRDGPVEQWSVVRVVGARTTVADDRERHVYTVTVHGTKKIQGNTCTRT